jgi:hypothetical protein
MKSLVQGPSWKWVQLSSETQGEVLRKREVEKVDGTESTMSITKKRMLLVLVLALL